MKRKTNILFKKIRKKKKIFTNIWCVNYWKFESKQNLEILSIYIYIIISNYYKTNYHFYNWKMINQNKNNNIYYEYIFISKINLK